MIPSADLDALVAALTSAITMSVATAVASVSAAPRAFATAQKVSTAINPYDTESMDLDSKEGKYYWKMVTAREDSWKPLSLTTDNYEAIADLFKDQAVQFGFDPIINVRLSGTGAVEANSRIVAGVDYCNMDFDDTINILKEPHKLTPKTVREYSAWFMGDESSTQTIPLTSSDMVIKAVDPNKAGNPGLVNRRKILLRKYSGMLNMILKNHLQRTSFTSLYLKSNIYEYKDKVSGRRIACSLVKLKLAFKVINPQLAVDHAIKEQEFEGLTITKCGNNVHTYLTTIQEKRI